MIITSFNEKRNNSIVICLGGFDSIHKGHKLLIERANDIKNRFNAVSAVFTYDNYFGSPQNKGNGLVFTYEERLDRLEKLGVDEVCVAHFDAEFSQIEPTDFFAKLCDNRLIRAVICGKDFKFGKNASGNIELLERLCKQNNIELYICDFVYDEKDRKVSSSLIKENLLLGNIEKVNDLLGSHYSISGEVVEGRKVGRKLGFPTANIAISKDKIFPKSGVYATFVEIEGKRYGAITNLGNAPTFNQDTNLVECHIVGFNGELYGKRLTVYFNTFIRDIRKFDSVDQLIAQLKEDLKVVL